MVWKTKPFFIEVWCCERRQWQQHQQRRRSHTTKWEKTIETLIYILWYARRLFLSHTNSLKFTIFIVFSSHVFSDVGMLKADNTAQTPSFHRSSKQHSQLFLAPLTCFYCNARVLHFCTNEMQCLVFNSLCFFFFFHIVIHGTCKLNKIHRISMY